jgi:hypothetical protein
MPRAILSIATVLTKGAAVLVDLPAALARAS